MNPIEHLWDNMAVYIRDMDNPPTTLHQLRDAVMAAWDALRPERLRSLVRSMPRRARALLAARGGHTRYELAVSKASDRSIHHTKYENIPIKTLLVMQNFPCCMMPAQYLVSEQIPCIGQENIHIDVVIYVLLTIVDEI